MSRNLGVQIVKTIKSLTVGLLFCMVAVSAVRAQITIDVSKFTCKEFLARTVT